MWQSTAALALAAGSLAGYATRIEPGWLHIHTQPIHLPRLKGEGLRGLRIAQISDIHLGEWMNHARLSQVIDRVLAQKVEIVLITGDFLTRRLDPENDLPVLAAEMERLAAARPTFAVMGNHDHWHGVEPLRAALVESGVQELRNRVVSIQRGDSLLHLAGIDDVWEGFGRLDEVVSHLPAEGAAILLSHEPDFADTAAQTDRFDLMLSGHSHGGQIVLPILGPPVLPHLGKKYPSGLYRVGTMWQYTNRGVGIAGSLPIRLNCPPEITVFTLV